MEIVNIKISELKNAEYNPRQADEKQVNDLKESIKRFGMVDPIIINNAENRKNVIIGGHFRVKVAKDMGILEVPCIFVNIPDIKKEQELNLRLNKNTGEWDWSLLANFDDDLLKDVGFESEEFDKIFDLGMEEDDFDAEAEAKKIKEPESKLGEVYQLGQHRLMCGDSTKKEDVEKLMNGQKADMIFTDPPYNIGLNYSGKTFGKKNWGGEKVFTDSKKDVDYYKFLDNLIKKAILFSKENVSLFFWCDQKYIHFLQQIYKENNILNKNICLWIKEHFVPTPQNGFNKVYEPCVVGWKGKPYFNKKVTKYDEILNQEVNNCNDFLEIIDLWLQPRGNKNNNMHPTQKPVALLEKPIKIMTKNDDIVVDFCGGSGTTLIGCEQMNRVCYLMELDPKYCDVIRNRYKRFKENQL